MLPSALRSAACVLLVVAAVASAGDAANLAPNPSFEMADGGQPAFWVQRTPTDGQRALAWDDQVARSGGRSVRIENRASTLSRWRTGHLHGMALEPGSQGTLAAWIRARDVQGGAQLRFYCMDARGRILSQPISKGVSGTRDWTEVTLPLTVAEGTAFVMLYLELTGTGTAWFDDVALTGTPASPAVTMDLPTLTYKALDMECLEGFTRGTRERRAVIELPARTTAGRARVVFWGETARYDLRVSYCDEPDGASSLRLLVNGKPSGDWRFDTTPADAKTQGVFRDKVIRGVDLQRWSRILLEGHADQGEPCRIETIACQPVGRFEGELLPPDRVPRPATLLVYEDPQEQRRARGMLAGFIGRLTAPAREAREAELAALKTPDDWRRRQERTRARLVEFFGDFGPKCPLRPRITGTLARPDYVIEKLVFESQPGYHCTANVYIPKGRKPPLPGILFTCGHAGDGKAYHLYHECCLGLVLKGYVVLALDPTGQGERSEYFDPETGKHTVPLCVSHHHYLARPSWLVGRTLAGYRTWDCIRALDYLVTRPEVDPEQIGACGNSGGGIMALLITAADERVKVCAAAHPGGSMEQTWLTGQRETEKEILSLIPPRPCATIVGTKSGEQGGHQAKLDDMWRFYEGLGVGRERGAMVLVNGVHDMKQPKREAAYGWLNRWLGKEAEGAKEPPLKPETVEALRCTKTGYALRDLGGESGQTLNARIAEALRPPRPVPKDKGELDALRKEVKAAVARRIGLSLPPRREPPGFRKLGSFEGADFAAEKLILHSLDGFELPSLLLRPKKPKSNAPAVVHVSDLGKPTLPARPSLALELVRSGHVILSVDVRGAGETDPRDRRTLKPLTSYEPQQFRYDSLAVRCAQAGTTMLALRTADVIAATDFLGSHAETRGRPIVLVGEGLGGLWALTAAAFDAQAAGVVCVATIPSYKPIVGSRYYKSRDYFWVPGALRDFDIPDLMALAAPRPVLLVDPMDGLLEPLDGGRCQAICAWPTDVHRLLGEPNRFRVVCTQHGAAPERAAAALAPE